jgi:hypothetical protein
MRKTTYSISPDFKHPSNSFRMVFSGPLPKNSPKRNGAKNKDPTFFCKLIAEPEPHTFKFFQMIPARLCTTLFSSISLINLESVSVIVYPDMGGYLHASPFVNIKVWRRRIKDRIT